MLVKVLSIYVSFRGRTTRRKIHDKRQMGKQSALVAGAGVGMDTVNGSGHAWLVARRQTHERASTSESRFLNKFWAWP